MITFHGALHAVLLSSVAIIVSSTAYADGGQKCPSTGKLDGVQTDTVQVDDPAAWPEPTRSHLEASEDVAREHAEGVARQRAEAAQDQAYNSLYCLPPPAPPPCDLTREKRKINPGSRTGPSDRGQGWISLTGLARWTVVYACKQRPVVPPPPPAPAGVRPLPAGPGPAGGPPPAGGQGPNTSPPNGGSGPPSSGPSTTPNGGSGGPPSGGTSTTPGGNSSGSNGQGGGTQQGSQNPNSGGDQPKHNTKSFFDIFDDVDISVGAGGGSHGNHKTTPTPNNNQPNQLPQGNQTQPGNN